MSLTVEQIEAGLAKVPQRNKELLTSFLSYAQQRLGNTSVNQYMRDAGKGAGPRDPSDRGPLRIVTGRLSRSLVGGQNAPAAGEGGPEGISEIEVTEDGIKLTYGTAVPYARAHEEGFYGVVMVPEHWRTITQAFGKDITPRSVRVRAHRRSMSIPSRPYLKPSLEDNLSHLQEELAERFAEFIIDILD